jgi:hypothetical protein
MHALGPRSTLAALAALGLVFCHPTDQPPVPPPKPTNPAIVAERAPAWVIDASIVTDGGGTWDGGFELDTGAGVRRTASQ